MTLERIAWGVGELARASTQKTLEQGEGLAGLAMLATMRGGTNAQQLLVARSILMTMHAVTPSVARVAGAATAVTILTSGRAARLAVRAPLRVLAALAR
jgi:hypothetical protein